MQVQKYSEQSLISKSFDSNQDNENGFDELWCRTCCEKISLRFLHLLTNKANVPSLSDMLSEVAKIDVKTEKGDGFPEHICDNCVYKLKIAYNFVLQAQQSNEYFEQTTCMLLKQNLNNSEERPITLTKNLTCESEFYDEFVNIEKRNVDTNSESYENFFEDVIVKDEMLLDKENNDEALVKSTDIPSPNIEINNDANCRRKNCRKILYTQTKKLNNKRYAWNPAAEQSLFELWESNLKHLTQTRRKGHIYKDISKQLSNIGFYHSAREVQVKINNMTQKYRKENCKIKSSADSQSMWVHYERVKRIIGGFKFKNIEQLQTENVDDAEFYEACLDDSISIDINARTQSSLSKITDRSGLMPSLSEMSVTMPPSPSFLESTIPISLESSMVESTPTSPKPKKRKSNSFRQRILTNSKKSKETPITLIENLTWEPDDYSDADAHYKMKNIEAESIKIGAISQCSKNHFKNDYEEKDEMTSGVESEIKDLCLNESITSEKSMDTPLPTIKINHNRKYKSKTYQNIEKLYSISQKRDVWSPAAERALLEIWELNSYRLSRTRKNGHLHREISAELSKLGFVHNPREVQVKMNNMIQKYRKQNRELQFSGASESVWIYYESLKRIIGDLECDNKKQFQAESFLAARLQDPIIVKSMKSPIPDTEINNVTSCKSKTHQNIVSLRNRKRKKIYPKNNKRYAWSREAEQALFKLWKSNLKHILGTHRKEHIYKKISVQLAKFGFRCSAREIQMKINNMTQLYRKENREIESSGDSRSMWVHYETVKSIIGDFKS